MLARLSRQALLLTFTLGMAAPLAAQPAPDAASAELRRQIAARFQVVPLKQGVALAGSTAQRRVEIDNGVVMADGVPLSGAELRQRLGADAALVLRLSYLDNATLHRLFAAPAAVPVPPLPPTAPAAAAPAEAPRAAVPPAPSAPEAPPVVTPPAPPAGRTYRRTGARLSVGKSIVVASDEDVTDAVVALGGNVRIDGRVRDTVVVVGGDLDLSPSAEVRGDITVLGGEVRIADGARHTGQIHHGVAGRFPQWRWPAFGWSRFDLGPGGRVLSLAGTLVRIALLALAVVVIAFVARGPVARIGAAASAAPLRAGVIGLVTQVLFIPALIVAAVVLAMTIVGIPFVAVVIPLAVLALFAAMLLGFTSLALRLGQAIGTRAGWTAGPAVTAAVVGLGVIVLPTIVARLVGLAPDAARTVTLVLLALGALVEYVAWTVGLGAAVMTGLGRWAATPPPLPPPLASDAPTSL